MRRIFVTLTRHTIDARLGERKHAEDCLYLARTPILAVVEAKPEGARRTRPRERPRDRRTLPENPRTEPTGRVKTDTLLYRLFQDRPRLIEDLTGLPVPSDAGYTLRAEEIKETAFRLDGLLVPRDPDGGYPLIFLEVQFQDDPDFYARWFAEIFLYLYRRKETGPWRAVVLYPKRGIEPSIPPPTTPRWRTLGCSGST